MNNTEKKRLANAAYREANRDAHNAHKREYNSSRKAQRQFVAIDSEGVSYGDYVKIGDDFGRIQRTIFWGASTSEGEAIWLDGQPYLSSKNILEWLVSLPTLFGPSIFVWFGSSYDATQIFADLPYRKAWELQHGKSYSEKDNGKRGTTGRYVLFGDFALSYIKQKALKVARLKDSNKPRNEKGRFIFSEQIVIYDVFGFFQSSFLKAAQSIPGSITDEERPIIERGKAMRQEFSLEDRDLMRHYTAVELHILARMMTALRASLEEMNLRLSRWQGAGSIAACLLAQQKARRHFAEVKTSEISREQEWAHHAFFGGRIETLKQGCTNKRLYQYDVKSAYPYHMSLLPSMNEGKFHHVQSPIRNDVETANALSMFRVRFETDTDFSPVRLNQIYGSPGPHFYPFPYRDQRGRITYPPRAHGIYMAEEVRAAFAWLDYYSAHFENRARNPFVLPCKITLEQALIFEPGNSSEPFAWLRDMYRQRQGIVKAAKESGTYDLTEKVIKLGINSVYGKTAQSVGSGDRAPGTACPWFAAAITAGTRAQLLRGAISRPPGSIVAFQTDGIVSTAPLSIGEGADLGQWEKEVIDGTSYFVQPGVYHLGKNSKHRGIKMDLLREDSFEQFLARHLPRMWREGEEKLQYNYRYYVTLGNAVASEERWKFAGWWVDGKRELQADNLGFKRAVPIYQKDKARREKELVDTLPKPAYFHYDTDAEDYSEGQIPLSHPHKPDWLDIGFGDAAELAMLNEEIAMTR